MKPTLSILYVYFNTPKEIFESYNSIKRAVRTVGYEVIIVDNNSTIPLPKELQKNKEVKVIKNKKNVGYGVGMNIASAHAKGKYLLIVNTDVIFNENSISELVKALDKHPKTAVNAPKIYNGNGEIYQNISGDLKLPGAIFSFSFIHKLFPNNKFSKKYWLTGYQPNREKYVEVVGGACMLIIKKVFDEIGKFDSQFFMYFEESDICKRIRRKGYKILYWPKAEVTHLIGKSSPDTEWVQMEYEKSRFTYFKKYHGLIAAFIGEAFLRTFTKLGFIIFCILLISLFLNLYKLSSLMLFIGDMGRDYIAARDMVISGSIPLVGIQSSVVWLHQGPLSVYFIGLAFILGAFNPVTPAILYAFLGVGTTYMVYVIGKKFFNTSIGLLASLFYATSPFVLVNTRMPYHTSPIPFFSALFFLLLFLYLSGKKYLLPFVFFSFGLLLMVELSNAVLGIVLFLLYFMYKPVISKSLLIKSFVGFVLGILPFVVYDITHKFVQTIGFPLWIFNRIRLFFGLTISGNSTTAQAGEGIYSIWQHIVRIIFPYSEIVVGLLLLLVVFVILKNIKLFKNKQKGLVLSIFWFIIPLIGFGVHTKPGPAYFPLLFIPISILLAFAFTRLKKLRYGMMSIFLCICIWNAVSTVQNDYYSATESAVNPMPPGNYTFGYSLPIVDEVARFIVKDAKGNSFKIRGGGFIQTISTSTDTYKYLVWFHGGKLSENSKNIYTIYQDKNEIAANKKIIYKNKYIYVTKNN